ncbi:MAG: ATP-dependent 6-phosphofructokinase [Paludisphaera borealis]|uniref:6-phosphofructokinase n=1 Tax=Paludisphaera borealis TaxID=1387353 RepID=UPI002840F4BF|nr:ATP-dependent 6-phosphofructokinase [Paludisphaera borealis]MDR3621065.1 ATP-dependent 6-phosphofructokinase [Paludisphaera borealis]
MKVGLLTGGGDCPGLNAVIRSVVRRIANAGGECVGVLEGWRGLVRGNTRPLSVAETDALIGLGGTILGSSRTNPYKNPETDVPLLRRHFAALELDALVVIGGDDTLGVAVRLINDFELPIVGIPKTIDNDLRLVDFSFGFDTAVNVVVESVERLRTTAESHRRVIVVETMGRSTGWIACFAGMAVGADYILVPEVPIDAPHLLGVLKHHRTPFKNHAIVMVAEGARYTDPELLALEPRPFSHPRLGGIGASIAEIIERQTRIETRTVVLGHLQRGGAPTAHDRILATRFGLAAGELVLQRRFGTVVTLKDARISETSLNTSALANCPLDLGFYQDAATFFYEPHEPKTKE